MNSAIAGLPITKVLDNKPYLNILIYGSSGVGKTRLAGSADGVPEMRRVLFIDVEGGTLTLNNSPYNEVDVVRVRSWPEMQNVYDDLYRGNHGYTTVIIDSLTEIQKLGMDYTMSERHAGDDMAVPEIKEWNINIEQTRKFVRLFRDLPMHTIITALDKTEQNKRTGAIKRKPSLSGKVADEVAAFLDIVVYLYIKEVGDESKRLMLTCHTEDTVAKDRSGLLPAVIENPTMQSIYNSIYVPNEELANSVIVASKSN